MVLGSLHVPHEPPADSRIAGQRSHGMPEREVLRGGDEIFPAVGGGRQTAVAQERAGLETDGLHPSPEDARSLMRFCALPLTRK